MKFGYTIIYVANVAESLEFFNRAFGLSTRFMHESGDYGELETGSTTLAFAAHSIAAGHFPQGFAKLSELTSPPGWEIALVTDDVAAAVNQAVAAGAELLVPPTQQPWGQEIAYVRNRDGLLIELCTPVTP